MGFVQTPETMFWTLCIKRSLAEERAYGDSLRRKPVEKAYGESVGESLGESPPSLYSLEAEGIVFWCEEHGACPHLLSGLVGHPRLPEALRP